MKDKVERKSCEGIERWYFRKQENKLFECLKMIKNYNYSYHVHIKFTSVKALEDNTEIVMIENSSEHKYAAKL